MIAVLSFSSTYAQTQMDLNKGTLLYCRDADEIGKVAFTANVQKVLRGSGDLVLQIEAKVSQCVLSSNGKQELVPYQGEWIDSEGGPTRYDNFELLVTSTEGNLIQVAKLNTNSIQTITISSQGLQKLPDGLIEVGARSRQSMIFQDKTNDDRTVFFGSYLTRVLK